MSLLRGAVALVANRLGFWPMQDTSGDIVDVVSGRTLTRSGATLGATGILPSESADVTVSFDGTDDYLTRDLDSAYRVAVVTIVCWCRIDSTDADDAHTLVQMEPRGGNGSGDLRGLSLKYFESVPAVILFKGTGAAALVRLDNVGSVPDLPLMIVARGGNSGGGLISIRELASGAAAWDTATDADTTAISWNDKAGGGDYPQPGQLYVGANKTNAAGSGVTVPDSQFSKSRHASLLIIGGTLSTTERDILWDNSVHTTFTNPAVETTYNVGDQVALTANAISGATGYDFAYALVTNEDTTTITPTVFATNQGTPAATWDTSARTVGVYRLYVRANGTSVWRVSERVTLQVAAPTVTFPTAGYSFDDVANLAWSYPASTGHVFTVQTRETSADSWVTLGADVPPSSILWTRPGGLVASNTARFRVKAKHVATSQESAYTESPDFTWAAQGVTALEAAILALNPRQYYPPSGINIGGGTATDYSGNGDDGTIDGTAIAGAELLPNSGASLDCTAGAHLVVPPVNFVGQSWAALAIVKIPAAQWSGKRNIYAATGDIDSGAEGKNAKAQVSLSGASTGVIGAIYTRSDIEGSDTDVTSGDELDPDVAFLVFVRRDAADVTSLWDNGVNVGQADINNLTEAPVRAAFGAYLKEDGTLDGGRLNSLMSHMTLFVGTVPTDDEIEALATQTQHAPPDVTEPDDGDVFTGSSVTHEWTAPNAEVEADISYDFGATWSVLFARQTVGTTQYVQSISGITGALGIMTRYRAWRAASSIVSADGYSAYVYRTWNVWRTALPIPPGTTNTGVTAVTDNAVRVDVTNTGQHHIRIQLDSDGGDFTSPLANVASTEATRGWVWGLPPNTKHEIRWRKEDSGNNPLGAWQTDRIYTLDIRDHINPSDDATHIYAHVTDVTGNSESFSTPGRYVTHSGDTVFTPLDPVAIAQLGVGMQEWSPDGDPDSRGALFGLRTDDAYSQDFGTGTWSTMLVTYGDASLNPRNQGLPRNPFAYLIVFVPWPDFEGDGMQEIGGGDGWWLTIMPNGELRLRVNLNAYGVSGTNTFAEAAPPEMILGEVAWGLPNIVYVAVQGPDPDLDIDIDAGCTISSPNPGNIGTIDLVGLLNNVVTQRTITEDELAIMQSGGVGCADYVAGYMQPDLGSSLYFAKGTSWGAENVVNVNGRSARGLRGAPIDGAYWNDRVLTAAQLTAILQAYGTDDWQATILATSPHIFPRFGELPGPRQPTEA